MCVLKLIFDRGWISRNSTWDSTMKSACLHNSNRLANVSNHFTYVCWYVLYMVYKRNMKCLAILDMRYPYPQTYWGVLFLTTVHQTRSPASKMCFFNGKRMSVSTEYVSYTKNPRSYHYLSLYADYTYNPLSMLIIPYLYPVNIYDISISLFDPSRDYSFSAIPKWVGPHPCWNPREPTQNSRESTENPRESRGIQGTEKELELLLILLAAALIDSKGDCTEDSQHHHLKFTCFEPFKIPRFDSHLMKY